jgi:hypothetical protein
MQAWFTLFTELDDKVNKAKRAGPEDMLRAMGKLQPSGLQLLSSLAATASSKQLASLELAEPLLLLKEAMFGAAAAAAAARAGEGYQGPGCWDACRWGRAAAVGAVAGAACCACMAWLDARLQVLASSRSKLCMHASHSIATGRKWCCWKLASAGDACMRAWCRTAWCHSCSMQHPSLWPHAAWHGQGMLYVSMLSDTIS